MPRAVHTKIFTITLWLVPFYLPVSVWLASKGLSIYALSSWKELVIGCLGLSLLPGLLGLYKSKDPVLRWLLLCMTAYVLLAVLYVFWADSLFEFGAGVVFATRFLLFFVVAWLLASAKQLKPEAVLKISIVSGVVLACFAILQFLVLSPTFLTHLGYEPIGEEIRGFPPAVTPLGEVSDFIRPQASLRGPNPLGAFLILPCAGLLWHVLSDAKNRRKYMAVWLVVSVAILMTFSRSAWIGAALACGTVLFAKRATLPRGGKVGFMAAAGMSIAMLAFGFGTDTGRLILLRQDRTTSVSESDTKRVDLGSAAIRDVVDHPLGYGPGNAGPVSALDTTETGKIAENYYLQVAQEVGWLGVTLFVAIQALLLTALYRLRRNPMALLALASGVALMVANLFLHTWADEAVSILWWSFAGAVVGTGAVKSKKSATLKRS